jgi:2-polyprenyl-6-hydroxyphenyl methylase/3-demethylubiquinone-9 3-methyltransferase
MVSSDSDLASRISFSFGRNWRSFARLASPAILKEAQGDIVEWIGADGVAGKTVIDIGCGSGIHSLGFHRLGARQLTSIDVDPHSVACTRRFWEYEGAPRNWTVARGNILDTDNLANHGQFDIVYSWGVLHHTGRMWDAIENASRLAKTSESRLWISIYAKGPNYPDDLRVKRYFNNLSWLRRRLFVLRYLYRHWRGQRRQGRSIREWFWHGRGMNAYHDAIDWFGGLPYEVATVQEVSEFLGKGGWRLERAKEMGEGGCSVYLFQR